MSGTSRRRQTQELSSAGAIDGQARMAWIEVISEDKAEGYLAELYDRERVPQTNSVDNILKVHSLRPETLDDHARLYRTLMLTRGALTPAEREMIGVVVSEINDCFY
jgi:alkylhydroperoxidase family enzyme